MSFIFRGNIMEKTDIYFRVSQLSWERVFLHFEISTNCEVEADFYLERFEKLKTQFTIKMAYETSP